MIVLPWVATYRRSAGASSAMLGMLRTSPTAVPNPVAAPSTTRSTLKEAVGVGFIIEIRARLPPSVKKSLLPGLGGVLLPPPPPQLARASRASASPIVLHRLDTLADRIAVPLAIAFLLRLASSGLEAARRCSCAGENLPPPGRKVKKGRVRPFLEIP